MSITIIKKGSCNKTLDFDDREFIVIKHRIMNSIFPRNDPEKWASYPLNPNYKISNWGRVLNLKSYRGKTKEIQPTIKMYKYPFITVSACGKRKGFALKKMVDSLFN